MVKRLLGMWEGFRSNCVWTEKYLRLVWPFIALQLVLLFFMTQTGQGQEILKPEMQSAWSAARFLFYSAIFCWLTWMLSRTVIEWTTNDLRAETQQPYENLSQDQRRAWFFRYKLPSITSVLFIPFTGIWLASDTGFWQQAIIFFVVAVAVAAFLWRQRLGYARYVLTFWGITAPLLFIIACLFPVTTANVVGATGVYNIPFVGFLFFMALAAGLVLAAYRYRVTLLVTTIVLLVLFLLPVDRHPIRECRDCAPLGDRTFPFGLDQALQRWGARNPTDAPRTMIVVAAAGGGSRASYWTGSVLGMLEDKVPDLRRHLFAISAVSGGALGAAAFAAAGPGEPNCGPLPDKRHLHRDCMRAFLSHDFLRPVLASFLTGDLLRHVVPLSLPIPVYDRGAALEKGWEDAWADTFKGPNRMMQAFDELWQDPSFNVNLLLNGTLAYASEQVTVDPGERAVTSNLLLEHWPGTAIINPAEHSRFYLTTAIDNSTRFPFVEPAGGLTVDTRAGQRVGIVDGGFYDNYGAATILDLFRQMSDYWQQLALDRLIIIQISSNPRILAKLDRAAAAPESRSAESACAFAQRADEPSAPANEVLTAYRTGMAAREWTGISYAEQLKDWASLEENGARGTPTVKSKVQYFSFGLVQIDPPLGWSLSKQSLGCIDDLLKDGGDADQKGDLIRKLVGTVAK